MFDDVGEYLEFIVRCVERREGPCSRSTLLDLAEYSAATFDRLRRISSGLDSTSELAARFKGHLGIECARNDVRVVRSVGDGGDENIQDVCDSRTVRVGDCDVTEPSCIRSEKDVVEIVDDSMEKPCGFVSSSSDSEISARTLKNRQRRIQRKERKVKRQQMNEDWRKGGRKFEQVPAVSSLRMSLEKKWEVQNELAVERARRQLEVLRASDVEQEVKCYRTKVSAATERNMVSIEKTHAKLRQTGNLPEERGGGFAETVVSGVPGLESGSGTISPDSSASMAEFRACQKALLDAERENAEYKRKIKIASEKYGFPLEQVDFLDKEVWTDTQTNQDILDEIYPNGYGKDTSLFEDGKFRAIGV